MAALCQLERLVQSIAKLVEQGQIVVQQIISSKQQPFINIASFSPVPAGAVVVTGALERHVATIERVHVTGCRLQSCYFAACMGAWCLLGQ